MKLSNVFRYKISVFLEIAHSTALLTRISSIFVGKPIVITNAGHNLDVGPAEAAFLFGANWAFCTCADYCFRSFSFTRFSSKQLWIHFSDVFLRPFSACNRAWSMSPLTPFAVNWAFLLIAANFLCSWSRTFLATMLGGYFFCSRVDFHSTSTFLGAFSLNPIVPLTMNRAFFFHTLDSFKWLSTASSAVCFFNKFYSSIGSSAHTTFFRAVSINPWAPFTMDWWTGLGITNFSSCVSYWITSSVVHFFSCFDSCVNSNTSSACDRALSKVPFTPSTINWAWMGVTFLFTVSFTFTFNSTELSFLILNSHHWHDSTSTIF